MRKARVLQKELRLNAGPRMRFGLVWCIIGFKKLTRPCGGSSDPQHGRSQSLIRGNEEPSAERAAGGVVLGASASAFEFRGKAGDKRPCSLGPD